MKVERFFRDVVEQNEQALYAYFTPDAQILWHCTNERFTAQEFIRANCEYPGSWEGEIERLEQLDGRYVLVGRALCKGPELLQPRCLFYSDAGGQDLPHR